MSMSYISVCSGIEAATVAWHPLGWTPVAFSEIEAFPSAVLASHYPTTPNLGDMTKFKEWPDATIDVLVGGTPCQSFSVAGLRKGLADPRGNLMLTFLAIADRYRPEWLVWENVPGVLSSGEGRDFGALLGGLAELGYGFAYRVLDAQYFGVAQRRRRVFVVANARSWQRAAAVLFERHCLQGNPAPSREAGKAAPTIPSRSTAGGGLGTDFDCDGGVIHCPDIVPQAMSSKWSKGSSGPAGDEVANLVAHSLRASGFDASEDGTGRGTPLVPVCIHADAVGRTGDAVTPSPDAEGRVRLRNPGMGMIEDGTAYNLMASGQPHAVVTFDTTQITSAANRSNPQPAVFAPVAQFIHANKGRPNGRQSAHTEMVSVKPLVETLTTDGHAQSAVFTPATQVRRLTPTECERLQGFPDDYTLIQVRGKPAADGPRYKALGNSMAVPVMAWIGRRIAAVASIS